MVYRISISNQKGGVGKTTVCLHLAVALSKEGREVLVVDLDPSAYLSEQLGIGRYYEEDRGSLAYSLVEGSGTGSKGAIVTSNEGVDAVPSNYDMRGVEDRLSAERNREMRLKMFLDGVDEQYDYTLVDSPPSLGALYDNAVLACRRVIIPIKDEEMSVISIHRTLDEIEEIEGAFGTSVEILAVVPNLVRRDSVAASTLERLRSTESIKNFLTPFEIRQRVSIRRAMKKRTTLFDHEPSCDQVKNFKKLADLVMSKCESSAPSNRVGNSKVMKTSGS